MTSMSVRIPIEVLRNIATSTLEDEARRGWDRGPVLLMGQAEGDTSDTNFRNLRSKQDDAIIGKVLRDTGLPSLNLVLFRMAHDARKARCPQRFDLLAVSFEAELPPWYLQRYGQADWWTEPHERGREVLLVTPDGSAVEAMNWRNQPDEQPRVRTSIDSPDILLGANSAGLSLHALLLAFRASYRDTAPGDPDAEDDTSYDDFSYRPWVPTGKSPEFGHSKVFMPVPHNRDLTYILCGCGWASDKEYDDVVPAEQAWAKHIKGESASSNRQSPTVSGGLPGLGKRR